MRAVFDVSVLVRVVFGSKPVARLVQRAAHGEFDLLVSHELLAELARSVDKPRLAARVDTDTYGELTSTLDDTAYSIEIEPPLPDCRDPKDRYLLALSRDGDADFLVTNDKDLLCLSPFGKCEIVTPEEFARRLEVGQPGG